MFDFLKKKKEQEFDFNNVENSEPSDEVKELDSNLTPGLGSPIRDNDALKPSLFQAPGQTGNNLDPKDLQLILAKVELLSKKIEDVDRKLSEVLEIAKASK